MSKPPVPFIEPVYVTRPMLGELDAYTPYFREIWDSRFLSNNGAKHQALEKALAKTLDAPHLKLFNNGTIALLAAARALELSGEVITTPFTFPATSHAMGWNGLTPVFCDIHPETLCIDPAKIEALITEKTSAIVGVHVYGMPCDVEAIDRIARKHELKVLYDAAHAFETRVDGESIARFGDISMFSFHATKLFHTLEGGALAFSDPALAEKIDLLRNFGIKSETQVTIEGLNGKMNEMQAAVGLVNLGLLEDERRKRAAVRAAYNYHLDEIQGIRGISIPPNVTDSLQYAVVRVTPEFPVTRDTLYETLKGYNVFTRRYFLPLCCDYECYRDLPSRHIVEARRVSQEVLCLPFYGALTESDVERICGMIAYIAGAASGKTGARTFQEVA